MNNKKTVKLIPRKPLYGIRRTPITNCVETIDLTIEEIRLCLITKCIVDEYLPDGTLVRLDFSNYDKNNNIIEEDNIIPDVVIESDVKQRPDGLTKEEEDAEKKKWESVFPSKIDGTGSITQDATEINLDQHKLEVDEQLNISNEVINIISDNIEPENITIHEENFYSTGVNLTDSTQVKKDDINPISNRKSQFNNSRKKR